MSVADEAVESLASAAEQLDALAQASESATGTVAACFEELAVRTDGMLRLGAEIVGCAQEERVQAILPQIQPLGAVLQRLIERRQQAVGEILDTLKSEAGLLGRLIAVTRQQRSVARETGTLGMLTDIEIAHLGEAGAGFVYLARELESFAQAVTESTAELAERVLERRTAIESARRDFAGEIPHICMELARAAENASSIFSELEQGLTGLAAAPQRFEAAVQEISGRINGVVAAVQTQDITRQQVAHVSSAAKQIAGMIADAEGSAAGREGEWERIQAGLTIQAAQLRSVQQTAEGWLAQMGRCMEGILEVGAGEVAAIGPAVLAQEKQLAGQLAAIEALEARCRSGSAQIEATCAGLTRLTDLIDEHLRESLSVRERVRLLMFNSIVEAGRLGTRADAMMEIARSIQMVAGVWSDAAEGIRAARDEVRGLGEAVQARWDAFVGAGKDALSRLREETAASRETLRAVAALAMEKAADIEAAVQELQSRRESAGETIAGLRASLAPLGVVVETIEEQRRRLACRAAEPGRTCSPEEAKALFAAGYTTEQERAVLLAALTGAALPAIEPPAGSGIELF